MNFIQEQYEKVAKINKDQQKEILENYGFKEELLNFQKN